MQNSHFKNLVLASNSKFIVNIPESLKEWLVDDFDFVIQQNKVILTDQYLF